MEKVHVMIMFGCISTQSTSATDRQTDRMAVHYAYMQCVAR